MKGKSFDGGDIIFDGCFYDYRDAGGKKGITLWIPPNVEYVRGILFHGNPGGSGGDRRFLARDLALQEFAARFGFGVAGVTWFPGGQVRTGTGKVILKVFEDWARMGKNPELAHVPFIARGSSNAGVTAYALACVAPERLICITPNVGPSYGAIPPEDAVLGVPAWMHVGPDDPFFRDGMEDTAELFRVTGPKGSLWAWDAEQNKKHEIGHIDDVDMAYYETCIRLRLPADADPRKGPVKLNTLRREDGWLADASTWEGPRGAAQIAPAGQYKGDPLKAVWLPTAEMAILYRAIATYNNPLKLRIANLKEIVNPNARGTLLGSIGGNMVDPGSKLVLECEAAANLEYEKVEFYQCGKKLGEVRRGEPLKWEAAADGSRAANAFVAVAVGKDGTIFTSYPAYVIVRDPKLSAALEAQRKIWLENVIATGSRPAAGSSAEPGKTATPASPDDPVLTAYGLTADQEEQFGKADGISPFWAAFGADSDRAAITPQSHGSGQKKNSEPAAQPKGENASMSVKAAHSRAGMYLLFEVSGGEARPDEGVDFHIARLSSKELWSGNPVVSRFSAVQNTLALSGMQYQANFGAADKPDAAVRLTYPCPFTMFAPQTHSDAEARDKYGIVVRRHRLEGGKRAMEWFIPWAYIGKPGPMTEPAVGTRLGLVLGYNGALNLRWPCGKDPWKQNVEQGQKENAWGDLEIVAPRF
ncbi:MAG: hypothetical protein HZA50_06210 [Planctomycetes bacterium]|nr:hypothetical protein [Planctomycetota bacterium]